MSESLCDKSETLISLSVIGSDSQYFNVRLQFFVFIIVVISRSKLYTKNKHTAWYKTLTNV